MKLLFLASGYPSSESPHRGIFNARAVEHLSQLADVTVGHFRFWKPGRKWLNIEQIDNRMHLVFSLPFIPGNSPFLSYIQIRLWSFWVYNLLKKNRFLGEFNIIHSVTMEMAPIGSYISQKTGAKHYTQATGSDVYHYVPKWESYWSKNNHWKLKVEKAICNSKAIQKELSKVYPDIKTALCYRGVNLENFKFKLRSESNPVKFLYIGGFDTRNVNGQSLDIKGGRFLAEVWSAAIQEANGLIELWVAGPGSNGQFGQQWKQTLTNPNSVRLLGNLKPSEIPEVMASAHVLLLPSQSEGLPNVVMEAMASGLLVAANSVGGVPELIQSNVNGFLLELYDKATWKRCLLDISKNFSTYLPYTLTALEQIRTTFDGSTYGKRLMAVYQEKN